MRHPGSSAGGHGAPAGACVLAPSLAIGRLSMWFAPNAMWGAADAGATAYRRRRGPCRLLGDEQRCACVSSADAMTLSDHAAFARRATSYHQPWPPRRRVLPDWESQLRWKKEPKPSSRQTLPLSWRVTKPPWGWLFSTATNSVR